MQSNSTPHSTYTKLTIVQNTTATFWRHTTPTWRDFSTTTMPMLPSHCSVRLVVRVLMDQETLTQGRLLGVMPEALRTLSL